MISVKEFKWAKPIPELIRTDINRIDGGPLRLYEVDNVKYPSVTSILGIFSKLEDGLDAWRDRIGHEEADRIVHEAAERGTHLHLIAEMYLNNNLDRSLLKGQASVLFRQIKKHIDKISLVLGTESTLYNKTLGYAGSADCIAIHDNDLCIVDFKNSRTRIDMNKDYGRKKLYKYQLQTTLYALALEDMIGLVPNKGLIIVGNMDNFDSSVFKYDINEFKEDALLVIEAFKKDDLELLQKSVYFSL